MQQLRSPSLRLVEGIARALHMPQSTSHVFDQTDQHTSQEVQSSDSHVNISEIIHRLKKSLCSSIVVVTLRLSALVTGIKTSWVPSGALGIHDCSW